MGKKVKKFRGLGFAVIFLCMVGAAGLRSHAADDGTVGTLYTVTADTEVREAADAGSTVLGELQAGTPVIVESEDGAWRKVLYQELEGYVKSDVLAVYAGAEPDSLTQEMNGVAEEEQRFMEEAELAARQRRSSLIWGTVVAALILVIFGLGVVTAVRNAKEEQKQDGTDEKAKESAVEDMDEGEGGR